MVDGRSASSLRQARFDKRSTGSEGNAGNERNAARRAEER